jgi:putative tryptophan/tyrosine transport system substrate-binding protein
MRRRELLSMLGGAAAAWPLMAWAQQPAMPVIGLLSGTTREARQIDAIWKGLNQLGYVEGRNVEIEYRWAEGHFDRLPALAEDLVRRRVALIIAMQSVLAPRAAKAATATIPIVFSIGGDAVKLGLVSSLNRPGGNVTGATFLTNLLGAKRLEILRELVPSGAMIGVLVNPRNPQADSEMNDVQMAASALGLRIHVQNASSQQEIDAAFEEFVRERVNAVTFAADAVYNSRRHQIVALAARHALPTMYFYREFAVAGGLMSYGGNDTEAYRLAGVYAGRVLKGEKPTDLPVQQSTMLELVINLKTAKALGLAVPPTLLALANEVIE